MGEVSAPSHDGENGTSLSIVVGAGLRTRRQELGLLLRETAANAEISPAHLSDIENGRSHASLPVLLRLCRVLQLPFGDLLPRLGRRRILRSRLGAGPSSVLELSHPDLELVVHNVNLEPGAVHQVEAEADEDVFAFVVAGDCHVEIAGDRYTLGERDALDVEHATTIRFEATGPCRLLICRGMR